MKNDRCIKCGNIAFWEYVPIPNLGLYCDDSIPRGCSCTSDPDTGEYDKDEQGRLLPCCEYGRIDDKATKGQERAKLRRLLTGGRV